MEMPGKDKQKKSKLNDQTIIEAFKARDRTQKDGTLPITEWAYRLKVVQQFLRAGIPIGKIDMLRSLLKKNGQRLTARAHLGQYISIVFKRKAERINNYWLSLVRLAWQEMIFDGGTRQGEAIAVIVRFLDDNWSIIQRLVRTDICSKSVNADDLAQVLNQCLSVDYGVEANSLLAAMRDGASVNQAALD